MIISSFHTHTMLCKHADGEPKDYILAANDFLGTEHTCAGFGFSDHCPYPEDKNDTWPGVRMTKEEAFLYKQQVKDASKDAKFPVFLGFECEWDPYYQSWYKDFLIEEIQSDYLVLGQHWLIDGTNRLYIPDVAKDKKMLFEWTDLTLEGINTGYFSFLAHPDLCMARGIEMNDDLKACFTTVLQECELKQFPIEVNGNGLNTRVVQEPNGTLRRRYPFTPFWELAQNYNIRVICNSDAHTPDLALKGAKDAMDYISDFGIVPVTNIM